MSLKSTAQRNVCREFPQLNNLTSALTSFSVVLKLWFRLLEINARCKQEQSTEYTEEVKWLNESCSVFRCIEFNQSDFDKPIMFVCLTIAHITISLLSLLSVCQGGSIKPSFCSIRDAPAHTVGTALLFPPLSAASLPHITHFDSMWMRSLREATAPYRESFRYTPRGHFP